MTLVRRSTTLPYFFPTSRQGQVHPEASAVVVVGFVAAVLAVVVDFETEEEVVVVADFEVVENSEDLLNLKGCVQEMYFSRGSELVLVAK